MLLATEMERFIPKILLIEDNPADVWIIRDLLENTYSRNLEMTYTERVGKALNFLTHETYDVILVDLGLPDSQGMDTLRVILSGAQTTPVIVLTSLDDESIGIQAVRQGAQDYLVKGEIGADILARSIRYSIERYKSEGKLRQTLKELQTLEARYRSLVEQIPVITYIAELNEIGATLYVSPQIESKLGYSQAEWLYDRELRIKCIHPEDRARVLSEAASARINGHAPVLEYRMVSREGRNIWFCDEAVIVRDEEGAPLFLQGVMLDISDRKRAEEALRMEKFRTLVESAPEAIMLQSRERFDFVNAAALRLFGATSANQLLGQPVMDRIHPAHRAAVRERIRSLNDKRQAVPNLEQKFLRLDGTSIDVGVTAVPFVVEGRNGALVFAQDISERKRAEEALRASEEKYRELVQNANSIIIRMSTDGKITFFNEFARRFFGYTEEEIIGRTVLGTIVPEIDSSGKDLRALVKDVVKHPERYEKNENENVRSNGERVWVNWTNRAIVDRDGRVCEILSIGNDMTELKQLEKQLRQSQRQEALGTLAGGIAHDFNNILGAIIINSEMAMDEVSQMPRTGRKLERIYKASVRGRDLVEQILTFSRRSEQKRSPLLILPIIKEAVKMMRSTLFSTIEVSLSIAADKECETWSVMADPTQIHQVVVNLCNNAAHAMREEGGVLEILLVEVCKEELSSEPPRELGPGRFLKMTVSDTGHGMSETVMDQIFNPFFTTKPPGEGTGLGLAVVYGIVKGHAGAIEVESRSDKGTSFQVYLPLLARDLRFEHAAQPDAPSEPAMKKVRILIVDDEDVLALSWADELKSRGHAVTTKTKSLEALEVFSAQPDAFDLVITDQTMPHLTGLELARQLLRIRPDVPIILCTGHSRMVSSGQARASGIRELIIKPFGKREMVQAVQRALEQSR